MKLTIDLIARGTSGYTKKKRDESVQHYLKRLTHLYLDDKGITEVGDDLALCRNLVVLYLYDNFLTRVPGLHQNDHLTQLYLQNNNISRIEHLGALTKLRKLYLGGNSITVIEGLENLDQLQELHIENQKLPPGEKLLFDPRSLVSLASCLKVLNISNNNIDSILELECLQQLTNFLAMDNLIMDLSELAKCLSSWRSLWRLDLTGNPVAHRAKYRERVIVMCNHLEILDNKDVNDVSRKFLKSLSANRERRKLLSRKTTEMGLADNEEEDLPPVNTGQGRHVSVPGFIMPGLQRRQFQEVLARASSMPSSNFNGTRDLSRYSYTDIQSPRYLNSFGTVYHVTRVMSSPPKRHISLVNMGAEFANGDINREKTHVADFNTGLENV